MELDEGAVGIVDEGLSGDAGELPGHADPHAGIAEVGRYGQPGGGARTAARCG